MGELSGGRSATWPTFFRSTSVRTRMLLQKSQTVWTLLDQRKTILAPQFGQLATGWVIGSDSLGLRHRSFLSHWRPASVGIRRASLAAGRKRNLPQRVGAELFRNPTRREEGSRKD